MFKSLLISNMIFFLIFCSYAQEIQKDEETIEQYKKILRELSNSVDYINEFINTFDILCLFLSPNRFSVENTRKISNLESPYRYFGFLDRLSYDFEIFKPFRFHTWMEQLYSKVNENPQDYYESYERLRLKADGYFGEIFADYFLKFFANHIDYILTKLEPVPNWKVRLDRLIGAGSAELIKDIINKLPDTQFGNEVKGYLLKEILPRYKKSFDEKK